MVFDLVAVAKDIRLEVYVRVDLERASAEMADRGRGERGVAEGEAA